MLDKIRREPVLIMAVVVAVLNLAVGLGYLSQSEGDATASMLESVVVLALGFVARDRVTPTE